MRGAGTPGSWSNLGEMASEAGPKKAQNPLKVYDQTFGGQVTIRLGL